MKKLEEYNCLFLDSSPFIYFIEENKKYLNVIERIFSGISYGDNKGISSYVTLLEVLVKPIQAGHREVAMQYRDLMLGCDYLRLYPLDGEVAETAATLRAKYHGNGFKIKTPDAIQVATAILYGAEAFVTNDCSLKRLKEIDVILLDELIDQGKSG